MPKKPMWFDQPRVKKGAEASQTPLGKELHAAVEHLWNSPGETKRREDIRKDLELYLGQRVPSLIALSSADLNTGNWNEDDLVFNVCYSLVNTVRNRVCSFRPRVRWVPSAGPFKARKWSADMTAMSDAWSREYKYQRQASFAFRDILTSDGGVIKIYRDGESNRIVPGRFPSWEFVVDEAEGQDGEPECKYHVRHLPVDQVANAYGIPAEDLRRVSCSLGPGVVYSAETTEVVRVVEAWKRNGDAAGGRHVLMAGDFVLDDSDWDYDGFPVAIGRFDENPKGYWGRSGISAIRGIQLELNQMQVKLREAHHNMAAAYIQLQNAEDATKITNEHVNILRYSVNPATINTPPAINGDAYNYVKMLRDMAYETWGVSQFVATGTKQAGVNSAVAIRETAELQSDRLALCSQIWEDMCVEANTWWWRLTRDMVRADKSAAPKWKAISRGAWREMTMEHLDEDWIIEAYPTSLFGQSISARVEKAMELAEAKWITEEDAMRAVDVPDLSPVTDLKLAESFAIEALVDNCLLEGKFQNPPRLIDPEKLHTYARQRYMLAISDQMTGGTEYPDENISQLTKLIDAAAKRVKDSMAAAAGAEPAEQSAQVPEQLAAQEAVPALPSAGPQ